MSKTALKPAPRPTTGSLTPLTLHRCPYCHHDCGPVDTVVCQRCLARHHVACWDEAGRCSACGSTARLEPWRERVSASALVLRFALAGAALALFGGTLFGSGYVAACNHLDADLVWTLCGFGVVFGVLGVTGGSASGLVWLTLPAAKAHANQ